MSILERTHRRRITASAAPRGDVHRGKSGAASLSHCSLSQGHERCPRSWEGKFKRTDVHGPPRATNLSRALTARCQPDPRNKSFAEFQLKGIIKTVCIRNAEARGAAHRPPERAPTSCSLPRRLPRARAGRCLGEALPTLPALEKS